MVHVRAASIGRKRHRGQEPRQGIQGPFVFYLSFTRRAMAFRVESSVTPVLSRVTRGAQRFGRWMFIGRRRMILFGASTIRSLLASCRAPSERLESHDDLQTRPAAPRTK